MSAHHRLGIASPFSPRGQPPATFGEMSGQAITFTVVVPVGALVAGFVAYLIHRHRK